MLNKLLYEALERAFGSVVLGNENSPGSFQPPRPPTYYGQRRTEYAHMTHWGETYSVCCPSCKDTRSRLCFSHRWGTNYREKGKTVKFSRFLAHCFNEQCDLRPIIAQIHVPSNYADIAIDGTVSVKKTAVTDIVDRQILLPRPSLSLMDPELPAYVSEYLKKRDFDPETLTTKYGIRFVDRGAHWDNPETQNPYTFFDSRLLIPVVQHRLLLSWQARALKPTEKRFKYIFPPGAKKSGWLYNFDKALMYRDIIITEGVTNVWRIGDNAVAMFGKAMSEQQLYLFKTTWGYDGRAIVCLDEDTYENQTDITVATVLLMEKAFPRGVAILRLRNGDAADHTRARLWQLMKLAFEKAVVNHEDVHNAIVDETDITEQPSEEQLIACRSREMLALVTAEDPTTCAQKEPAVSTPVPDSATSDDDEEEYDDYDEGF